MLVPEGLEAVEEFVTRTSSPSKQFNQHRLRLVYRD